MRRLVFDSYQKCPVSLRIQVCDNNHGCMCALGSEKQCTLLLITVIMYIINLSIVDKQSVPDCMAG